MEKAIEIKRRAQRCILNGDLDGALAAYEKLVASGDPDPYYCVLLADLLHKKNQGHEAQKRYFEALEGYSKQGLYKNAIAVCKKMSRLGIVPVEVTRRLAELHALDGFNTEASLCFLQHAELLTKQDELDPARASLQRAIELNPENLKALERLGEVEVLAGQGDAAVSAWMQAAERYEALGQTVEAKRVRNRAEQVRPGSSTAASAKAGPPIAKPGAGPPTGAPAAASRSPAPTAPSVPQDASAPSAFMFDNTPPGLKPPGEQAPVEPEPELELEPESELRFEREPEPLPPKPPAPERKAEPVVDEDGPPVFRSRPAEAANEPQRAAAPKRPPPPDDAPPPRPRAAPDATPSAKPPSRNGEVEREAAAPRAEEAPPRARPAVPAAGSNPTIAAAAAAAANREAAFRVERFGADAKRPGLDFGSAADADADDGDPGIAAVGALLREAQALFQSGNRTSATAALLRAAQAYDQMGRNESAAAIYRSMGNSTDSTPQLMMLWLKNCQRRNDRHEAARVACDLGDRAINDGDFVAAKEWFERARTYDPANELAPRRLRHLEQMPKKEAPAPVKEAPPPPPVDERSVNITTERSEPVIIDLGTLIQEFQRGVEGQLESDPQGHYDLGMSYREMGLLEPAIESFRTAAVDPKFFLRSKELIGRCLLDLGHFDEAAEELRQALSAPDLRASISHDLRYQLGLALEAAGRSAEALEEFERVYSAQANYPDVAMKIRVLRKTVESR